jgi:hypothetical protein
MKNLLFFSSLLISTALIFAACGSGGSSSNASSTTNTTANTSNSPAVSNLSVAIKNSDGAALGQIDIKNNAISLQYGDNKLVSETKGEKRKYGSAAGQVAAEVKHSEADKFKVRTPEGTLIWKIKLDTDKIKISDNEENNNPYSIKRGDGKIKVKAADESELGTIEVKDGKVVVLAAGRSFTAETGQLSAAYGVLLMDKISDRDKFIIMAELLAKGQ